MKTIQQILSHLFFTNSNKLNEAKCFEAFRSLLVPSMYRHILYMYKKNNNIHIALDAHTSKTEFYYKRYELKSILNKLSQVNKKCISLQNCVVIPFVSPKHKTNETKKQIQSYKERATGNFEIQTDNEELKEIFNQIKNIIKEKV